MQEAGDATCTERPDHTIYLVAKSSSLRGVSRGLQLSARRAGVFPLNESDQVWSPVARCRVSKGR